MRFSVVIPIYNKEPHIDRSISSVLNQSHPHFELLLVDDASTDNSYNKMLSYTDARIKTFRRDRPGPGGYAARNLAIENAEADWICFLDADDEWDANYLQKIAEVIKGNPKSDIISCAWETVDGNKKVPRNVFKHGFIKNGDITEFSLKHFLQNSDLMWTGAITIRRSLLIKAGLFPKCSKCVKGGDLDTWIRCLEHSHQNIFLDYVLSYYYRDTVNRVTDHIKNPSTFFCAEATLRRIFIQNNEKELRSAIKQFANRHIYLILIKNLRITGNIEWKLISKFYFSKLAVAYFIKLMLEKIRVKMKGK